MRAARRRLPLVDFAGCRVSDVSWLLLDQTQVSRKAGWMTVGHKGGKERTIDLVNEVRSPLYEYLHQGEHKGSAYVFTSQRVKKRVSAEEIDGWRWTEDGIHQWWQQRNRTNTTLRSQVYQQHRLPRVSVTTLLTERGQRAGAWKRSPITWDILPKRHASHSNHEPLYAGEP